MNTDRYKPIGIFLSNNVEIVSLLWYNILDLLWGGMRK